MSIFPNRFSKKLTPLQNAESARSWWQNEACEIYKFRWVTAFGAAGIQAACFSLFLFWGGLCLTFSEALVFCVSNSSSSCIKVQVDQRRWKIICGGPGLRWWLKETWAFVLTKFRRTETVGNENQSLFLIINVQSTFGELHLSISLSYQIVIVF